MPIDTNSRQGIKDAQSERGKFMSMLDISIVVIYILALLFMGFMLSRSNETQEDYFVGGRSMPWLPVALSIAATTISANGFIGGPGWSYSSGISAFMLQFSIPLVLLVASVYFIPFLYNLKVTSCYQYVDMRFGKKSAMLSSIGFLLMATFQISSMVYIPSLIIQQLTGWELTVIVPIIVIVVILYTIIGGIKAVIWTDAIQMVVLWVGLIATIVISLNSLDIGFLETVEVARAAGKMNALNFSFDITLENGFWVALIGGMTMWGQYYLADQSQVQRMISSKSIKAAKSSLASSGIIMNTMFMIFMFVGIIMYSFYNGAQFESSNLVMIEFILNHLPTGLLGLMISAVFAAAMSSIDSLLNSMTTVFVKNIFEPHFAKNGEEATMKHTIAFTAIFGVVIIAFTILGFGGTTASVLATVGGYISFIGGSIFAVFLLGMFTHKANDLGVSIGFVAGCIATWLLSFTPTNWLWYSVVGTIVASLVGYIASLIIGGKTDVSHIEQYTLFGQRRKMIADGNDKVDIPGTFDKYAYIQIAFFIIQFIVLLWLS